MTLADPAILDYRPGLDEPPSPPAARSGATAFASPARKGGATGPEKTPTPPSSGEAAYRACLQDYAEFVLDQEAEYCQE